MSAAPRLPAVALLVLAAAGGCREIEPQADPAAGEIALFDDLYSVSVADPDHAVAVGYHGAAYYSADGGRSWRRGDTGTERSLYSVSMADARSGWAVGQLGTVLHTRDGGAHWSPQPNPKREQGLHLLSVHALDAGRAWVVGEWGTRMRTADGGATWEDRSLRIDRRHPRFAWLPDFEREKLRRGEPVFEDLSLADVHCLDPPGRSCWIVGEFGTILHSEDGGEHWQPGRILGDIPMDPIELAPDQVELEDADRARLRSLAARVVGRSHLRVRIEAFAGPEELARLGDPDDPGALFELLEGRLDAAQSALEEAGLPVHRLRTPGRPPWDFEDFLEDDPGFLRRYLEGRRAQRPLLRLEVVQHPYLFDVHFDGPERGLISGLGGMLLRSDDGGRSWRHGDAAADGALFAVAGLGERALAVGERGLVRLSEDGGSSWQAPDDGRFPPPPGFLRDLDFEPGGQVGMIVGQAGSIWRSGDGGLRWSRVLPPVSP